MYKAPTSWPVSDFECDSCHTIFQEQLSMTQHIDIGHQALCPDCGGLATKIFNPHPVHSSWGLWKVPLNQG